jgi:hypothetical protein
MIRQSVAIGSWLVLAAVSLVPVKARSQVSSADVLLTAAAFFISAATTRYWLRDVRTREQILAFVAAAVVLTILRGRVVGHALSVSSMVAGGGGAVTGSLLVKFWLEGLPF